MGTLKNLSLGMRFKICRITANLSQEGAASTFGVDRRTVGRWERNESKPQLHKRTMIQKAFKYLGDI